MSRHNDSNTTGGDTLRSDIAGRNPVADSGRRRRVSTQAQKQARPAGVGDHNTKSRGGELKKYRGVSRNGSKWVAGVFNGNSDQKSNRVYLGTFPTAEMAAIAYDTSTLFLRGDSSVHRLNFPRYASQIKNILKGCSSSISNANIKFVAEKGAQQLGSLTRPEKKDRGSKVSSLINAEQKDQGLEVSAPISPQQTDNHGLQFSAAIRADTSTASALATQIPDYQQESSGNQQIQQWQPRESYGGVVDNTMLMESHLRYSPDCVLLRPVPGANTHPAYIYRGYQ